MTREEVEKKYLKNQKKMFNEYPEIETGIPFEQLFKFMNRFLSTNGLDPTEAFFNIDSGYNSPEISFGGSRDYTEEEKERIIKECIDFDKRSKALEDQQAKSRIKREKTTLRKLINKYGIPKNVENAK